MSCFREWSRSFPGIYKNIKRGFPSYNGYMDTIIYLLLDKECNTGALCDSPPVFSIREKQSIYRMVFVGIPRQMLKEAQEAGSCAPEAEARQETGSDLGGKSAKLRRWLRDIFSPGGRKLSELDAGQEAAEDIRQEMSLKRRTAWAEELAQYLSPYLYRSGACYYVCAPDVERWLSKEKLWGWWQEHWPIPAFPEFHELPFVDALMKHNTLTDYLVLGYAPCVLTILRRNARHIRSLRLVLEEAPGELEELLEDLNEEYGLAAAVQLLSDMPAGGEASFRSQRIFCLLPSVVLDFSKESHILTADIARDSIWLDMDSQEEKRRRIEERNTGIHYFSMQKEWKELYDGLKNGVKGAV